MKLKFKFTERDTEYYRTWFSFYPRRNRGVGFELTYHNNGYFDPRPEIHTNVTTLLAVLLPFISLWLIPISLIFCIFSWGSIYLHLPFDTGRGNTSESKVWGVTFYHVDSGIPTEIWFRGSGKSVKLPWAKKFRQREIKLITGWYTEQKGDDLWDTEKWKDKILVTHIPYKYTLNSGEIQKRLATVTEERRTWTSWFGLIKDIRHYIEIEFDKEVGESTGSWKGGTIGCSFLVNEGESVQSALSRMETTRKFK